MLNFQHFQRLYWEDIMDKSPVYSLLSNIDLEQSMWYFLILSVTVCSCLCRSVPVSTSERTIKIAFIVLILLSNIPIGVIQTNQDSPTPLCRQNYYYNILWHFLVFYTLVEFLLSSVPGLVFLAEKPLFSFYFSRIHIV